MPLMKQGFSPYLPYFVPPIPVKAAWPSFKRLNLPTGRVTAKTTVGQALLAHVYAVDLNHKGGVPNWVRLEPINHNR
jgi:hypothetical protein